MFHVLPFMSRLLSRAWLNPGQWPDPPLAACLILSQTELVGKQKIFTPEKYSPQLPVLSSHTQNWLANKRKNIQTENLNFGNSVNFPLSDASCCLRALIWSIWFAYQVSEVNWVDGGFSNHKALVFTIRGRESQQCVHEIFYDLLWNYRSFTICDRTSFSRISEKLRLFQWISPNWSIWQNLLGRPFTSQGSLFLKWNQRWLWGENVLIVRLFEAQLIHLKDIIFHPVHLYSIQQYRHTICLLHWWSERSV